MRNEPGGETDRGAAAESTEAVASREGSPLALSPACIPPATEDTATAAAAEETMTLATPVFGGQPFPAQPVPRMSSGPLQNEVMGDYKSVTPPPKPVLEIPPGPAYRRELRPPEAKPPNSAFTHVPWQASDSWGATTFNISASTAAGASYLFWWVSGFLVYFSERNNRFVRFHALQSIILTGGLTVVGVSAALFASVTQDLANATHQPIFHHLGIWAVLLLVVAIVFTWLCAMIAAWTGNYLRLPIIGAYAERYSAPPADPSRHPFL